MKRRLAGLALDRLENSGLELAAAKIVSVTEELARKHYALLEGHGFFADPKEFQRLIDFLTSKFHNVSHRRVLALVYRGENAVKEIRAVVGNTNPEKAEPGTIRGSFGRVSESTGIFENVVHASGTPEEGEREVNIWFRPEEIVS